MTQHDLTWCTIHFMVQWIQLGPLNYSLSIFLLAQDWFKWVTRLNMLQPKTGKYLWVTYIPQLSKLQVLQKNIKMRTISSILAQKYSLIFVLEHYQATFLENWPFLGRNNSHGQISLYHQEHISPESYRRHWWSIVIFYRCRYHGSCMLPGFKITYRYFIMWIIFCRRCHWLSILLIFWTCCDIFIVTILIWHLKLIRKYIWLLTIGLMAKKWLNIACLGTSMPLRSINIQKINKKEWSQYQVILTEQAWSLEDLLHRKTLFSCERQWVIPNGQIGPSGKAQESLQLACLLS